MSPARVQSLAYGFEADFWSLGITVIVALTGKHPYPTTRGLWVLMSAILEMETPKLDRDVFPSDACDFVDACLMQPSPTDVTAQKLLQHPFIQSTYLTNIIATNQQAVIQKSTEILTPMNKSTNQIAHDIVEAALNWQLTDWARQCAEVLDPEMPKMGKFTNDQIEGLANQICMDNTTLRNM